MAIVAETDLTVEQIGKEDAERFLSSKAAPDAESIKGHCEDVQILAAWAKDLPVGARVGFSFPNNAAEIFAAGNKKQWGV
ncbi:MAG: hypothetical protein Q8K86_05990 [Candidatus Nanopelagicaceae bacterium]|nr:hypothetical protein [Candidatus Nanopelagicaceae bacterium]